MANQTCIGLVFVLIPVMTRVVCAGVIVVPDDQPTIQMAINVAADLDEIVVLPGTYNEAINFLGKSITLRSLDGPEMTVIDGSGLGLSVVTFHSGEGPDTVLRGFSITGGNAYAGGGLISENSSPTLIDCRFTGNTASLFGGGMFSYGGAPKALNCAFEDNTAEAGGGVFCESSAAELINCTVTNNLSSLGAGMYNHGSDAKIINCTFSSNVSGSDGGAMGNGDCSPLVVNSIFWNDSPDEIFNDGVSNPVVTYSNVMGGYAGLGNIDADPLFIDALAGNLRRLSGSPCSDAGNNWGLPVDAGDYDEDGNMAELLPVDQDGNPRLVADELDYDPGCGLPVVVDMGAFECSGGPAEVVFADLNADSAVNSPDLLTLLGSWGSCGQVCCLPDLDLDNQVGVTDLLALLAAWSAF